HNNLTDLRVVNSMHERKAMMAELSDGFIALPGGVGTLEEFFEIWTWNVLGLHAKPCGLLNISNYYHHITTFIDFMVAEGLLGAEHRAMVLVADDPISMLDRFASYHAPKVEKVIDRDET